MSEAESDGGVVGFKNPPKRIVERFIPKGQFGYTIVWGATEYHADFKAFEIVAEGEAGETYYFEAGSSEHVRGIETAEVFLEGHIKWDGCSHLTLDNQHLCGAASFKGLMALLEYAYRSASVLMGRGEDGLDEKWGPL